MGKKKKAEMMLYSGIMSAYPMISQIDRPKIEPGRNIPDDMILDVEDSGVFLGLDTGNGKGYYVGKRSTDDGNILVVGINGSGKSHFLAKSTLRTMDDPAVVLDIKGLQEGRISYSTRPTAEFTMMCMRCWREMTHI